MMKTREEEKKTQSLYSFPISSFIIRNSCLVLLGCIFITLSSLVKLPFYPVPFTLQSWAIMMLGLIQTPKQAFASALCYLLCATAGLPVLCGNSNSLWIAGKCGGYLIAFPIAAYLIAKLKQKIHPILAILLGQVVIFAFGFIWLIPLFGCWVALMQGVVLFIPSDLLKNLVAFALVDQWKRWKSGQRTY